MKNKKYKKKKPNVIEMVVMPNSAPPLDPRASSLDQYLKSAGYNLAERVRILKAGLFLNDEQAVKIINDNGLGEIAKLPWNDAD